jgi:hypothetical protein
MEIDLQIKYMSHAHKIKQSNCSKLKNDNTKISTEITKSLQTN